MKIAVCISGQPRSFVGGFAFLNQNLLSNFPETDIFIHSWENPYYSREAVSKIYSPTRIIFDDMPDQEFIDDVNLKYSTNTPNPKRHPPIFTYCAFESMYKSYILFCEHVVETNIQYDWVIKTRFDYALNGLLPLTTMDKSGLYIPNCRMVPTYDFGNDQFAVGSPDTMDKYMTTFKRLDKFYLDGVSMIGEEMMSANLKHYGMKVTYMDMNNPFPPGKYNGTWHSLIRDDYKLWEN